MKTMSKLHLYCIVFLHKYNCYFGNKFPCCVTSKIGILVNEMFMKLENWVIFCTITRFYIENAS